MAPTRTQLYVLAALAAGLVAVAVVPRGGGPAAPVPSTNAPGGAQTAEAPPVVDVNLETLKGERRPPADPDRNLFIFQARRQRVVAARTGGRPPVLAPPPEPVGPPPLPPIPLKFIGILEAPAKGRVAILSDGRGAVFHGREGDTIDGRYRLLSVGTEFAELSYLDGRGRQTVRLSGQ